MKAHVVSFAVLAAIASPAQAEDWQQWNITATGLQRVYDSWEFPPSYGGLLDSFGSFTGFDGNGDGEIGLSELKAFEWSGTTFWPEENLLDGILLRGSSFHYSPTTGLQADMTIYHGSWFESINFGHAYSESSFMGGKAAVWTPDTITVIEGPFTVPGLPDPNIPVPGIPEPASWLLAFGGLVVLGGAARARRKAKD